MTRKIFTILALGAAIAVEAQTSSPMEPVTFGKNKNMTMEDVVDAPDTYQRYTGNPAMDAFINAPQEVFPAIDKMTRMDMADYFNSGSPKPSKNNLKGECRIISATPDQISFTGSEVADVELSLLPMKSDTIIMVVTTLKTPVPDSAVKFYAYPGWEPVTKGVFIVPGLNEWTAKNTEMPREDIENAVPFILASFTYKPDTRSLVIENHIGDYLPRETGEKVKNALSERLVYKWTGSKFQAEK